MSEPEKVFPHDYTDKEIYEDTRKYCQSMQHIDSKKEFRMLYGYSELQKRNIQNLTGIITTASQEGEKREKKMLDISFWSLKMAIGSLVIAVFALLISVVSIFLFLQSAQTDKTWQDKQFQAHKESQAVMEKFYDGQKDQIDVLKSIEQNSRLNVEAKKTEKASKK